MPLGLLFLPELGTVQPVPGGGLSPKRRLSFSALVLNNDLLYFYSFFLFSTLQKAVNIPQVGLALAKGTECPGPAEKARRELTQRPGRWGETAAAWVSGQGHGTAPREGGGRWGRPGGYLDCRLNRAQAAAMAFAILSSKGCQLVPSTHPLEFLVCWSSCLLDEGKAENDPTPGGCAHPSVAVGATLCQGPVVSSGAWGGGLL